LLLKQLHAQRLPDSVRLGVDVEARPDRLQVMRTWERSGNGHYCQQLSLILPRARGSRTKSIIVSSFGSIGVSRALLRHCWRLCLTDVALSLRFGHVWAAARAPDLSGARRLLAMFTTRGNQALTQACVLPGSALACTIASPSRRSSRPVSHPDQVAYGRV
jgi:hypothetical protein